MKLPQVPSHGQLCLTSTIFLLAIGITFKPPLHCLTLKSRSNGMTRCRCRPQLQQLVMKVEEFDTVDLAHLFIKGFEQGSYYFTSEEVIYHNTQSNQAVW
jgi:hypothetical protein